MDNQSITPKLIEQMNYTDFISFIKETNRCPGGKGTIRKIIQNSFINRDSKILEIGSNTGFTSLEIAHSVKCNVTGIDVSKSCVSEANSLLSEDSPEIKRIASFKEGSAYDIPYANDTFDLVITGGATSFMEEKSRAVSEYKRVLKTWGFLSVTQLFYITKPPQEVVNKVSKSIGVKIEPWTEKDWLDVFTSSGSDLELYYYEKNELTNRSENVIKDYINYFMKKPHLNEYSEDIKLSVKSKWREYIDIFNENHKYLGYFIALFRKRAYPEEPELFIKKQ